MRKRSYLFSITLILVVSVVLVFALQSKEATEETKPYVLEFLFKENGSHIEVRVEEPSKETVLYQNGELVSVISIVPRVVKPVLQLPRVREGFNLVKEREKVSELTWKSSLEESAKYLYFLESEGYRVVREAHTPQFIEKIMEFSGSKKRIIIFNHTILVGDLYEDAVLPDVKEYITKLLS